DDPEEEEAECAKLGQRIQRRPEQAVERLLDGRKSRSKHFAHEPDHGFPRFIPLRPSCMSRAKPLAQDEAAHDEQRGGGNHASEYKSEIDAVASGTGVIGGADEPDAVEDAREGERHRRAVNDVLHRLHEHLQGELVAIDLPVDFATAIQNGGLRRMIESTSDRAVAEAEVIEQGFDAGCITAGYPPIRELDALRRGELGQSRDRVVACVEPDRQHRKTVGPEHPSRFVNGADEMLGRRRANRAAGRIDQADNEWFATIVAKRQPRSRRIDQFIVADRPPDDLFASCDHRGGIKRWRRGPCGRSRHGRKCEQGPSSRITATSGATGGHDQYPTALDNNAPVISNANWTSEARKFAIALALLGSR